MKFFMKSYTVHYSVSWNASIEGSGEKIRSGYICSVLTYKHHSKSKKNIFFLGVDKAGLNKVITSVIKA